VYFYIARELLPSLFLFGVAFVGLGLAMVGLVVIWTAGKQIARMAQNSGRRRTEARALRVRAGSYIADLPD
jgi:hypothetical protein